MRIDSQTTSSSQPQKKPQKLILSLLVYDSEDFNHSNSSSSISLNKVEQFKTQLKEDILKTILSRLKSEESTSESKEIREEKTMKNDNLQSKDQENIVGDTQKIEKEESDSSELNSSDEEKEEKEQDSSTKVAIHEKRQRDLEYYVQGWKRYKK